MFGGVNLLNAQNTAMALEQAPLLRDSQAALNRLRRMIIEASAYAQEGHIPSAFSILNILWVLYTHILQIDPKHPDTLDRDRFVLSKGHASLGLYAVLADKGFFPLEELDTFGRYNSSLGGHPDTRKVPGVEASTGSLGHGFPMAVGMALGFKIKKQPNRVFCLVGDGECNEGSIWESALLASHHQLSNLCCIVDYNHSTDRALLMGDLAQKFNAFAWETLTIDGHNEIEILEALTTKTDNKPLAIIAETIKGFGCAVMENEPAWHHKFPTEAELETLIEGLS